MNQEGERPTSQRVRDDQSRANFSVLHQVAEVCVVAAVTAPKSGCQLFLKGSPPLLESIIVDSGEVRSRLAVWLRDRGARTSNHLWDRDADTAKRTALHLFIGLADWYPPFYDCGACGYATCAEFLNARRDHMSKPDAVDWGFRGPVCQLRCVDLGIAVGSAVKVASLHNVDVRCQTRVAAAARALGVIRADLAVCLSMNVSHKNIFFDRPATPSPGEAGLERGPR